MNKTKIAIILRKYPFGGAERQALLIIETLKKKNCEVEIFSIEGEGISYEHKCKVIGLNQKLVGLSLSPPKLFRNIKLYKTLFKLINNKYEIVITYTQLYLVGIIFNKLKTCISIRMFYPNTKNFFRLFLLKKFDMIITNNFPQFSLLSSLKIKSIFVNNVIKENIIPFKKVNNEKFKCLVISNYSQRKNIEIILKAFQQIDIKSFELTIIGEIKFNKKSLEIYNQENIHWLGYISPELIKKYYQQSNCLIHASLREGASNAILDAMNYRLPIIASNIPENISLIGNNINFLFNTSNANDLAKKIEYLNSLKNSNYISDYLDFQKMKIKNDYSIKNNEDFVKKLLQ